MEAKKSNLDSVFKSEIESERPKHGSPSETVEEWLKRISRDASQAPKARAEPTMAPGMRGEWNACCQGEFELVGHSSDAMRLKCLVCGKITELANPRMIGYTSESIPRK